MRATASWIRANGLGRVGETHKQGDGFHPSYAAAYSTFPLWEGAMRPIRGHGPLPQDIVRRETTQNAGWTMGCAPTLRKADQPSMVTCCGWLATRSSQALTAG